MTKQRKKHVPQRTCVACRRKLDKRRLTRIVRSGEEGVIVDLTGKRNGRGAYLCDQRACWDEALAGSVLDRALQTQISKAQKDQLDVHKPQA